MDKKAANEGDKLKHPLLLEVLSRCEGWPSLTYAETHAGAGVYHASAQGNEEGKAKYIDDLYEEWKEVGQPAEDAAGGRYYHLLRNWWSDEKRIGDYPGSVLQAAIYLSGKRRPVEFRVTEADKATFDRLEGSVADYGIKPAHQKFQNRMYWLAENDSLVLLVDPLRFRPDYGAEREKYLNKGGIDIAALDQLLAPCWTKRAATVLIWCSFTQGAGPVKKRALDEWLKTRCAGSGASLSSYSSHQYTTFIVGIGYGKAVADALPKGEWRSAWPRTIRTGL